GLLVELGDVEALKNALIDLLTKPDWSHKLGEAARRKAEETYSLKRCAAEYEALFLSTLS
ncbi:MAG: glycosyltransferase, partial [Nitrososphaera sp.]|nr:glycosyltransferase [Nitrososphaera sp.]